MKRPLIAVVACLWLAHAAVAQQVTNPIPAPIVKGGVRIRIDDLVQMPATLSTVGKTDNSPSARARINFLRESPDGRLFVNDLRGQLYTLDANYQPQLYLDIDAANGGSGSIFPATWYTNGLAAGFISFNFHPEFQTNGLFYTIHMERAQDTMAVPDFATVDERTDGPHPVKWHTIVTEWNTPTPAASSWSEATGSRREILRVGTTADQYFHPYGDLQFNPLAGPGDADYGLMYISGGDWGYINGAGAPQGSGTEGQPGQLQRLDTLAGTMLRIDPRSPTQTGGQAGIGDYAIPAGNPFVDGNPNTLDEIYAFGFRNGHRMAWDMDDGSLYVTNIGHANLEEIDRIIPGGNYGWAMREGTFVNGNDLANGGDGDADHVFVNNVPNALDVDFRGQEFLYPVAQYDHGEGASIAGGFVYSGQNLPQLQGKFLFGDIVRGRLFVADMESIRNVDITEPNTNVLVEEVQLFTVDENGAETNINDLRTIVGNSRADLRFGVDSAGEIYIMTKTDGFIRKLVGLDALDQLVMTVNRTSGEISFRNPGTHPIEIDGYSILSGSGSLDPVGGWLRLGEQGLPGWDDANSTADSLSETNPNGSLTLHHLNSWSLGNAFAPNPSTFGVSVSDLEFHYTGPNSQPRPGIVEYVGQDLTNNLVLTVDPTSGEARLKNTSQFPVAIDGYSILSDSGSLQPGNGNWNSLTDQAISGWVEADPLTTDLSELNPLSFMTLQPGDEFDLGKLFNIAGSQDLKLEFQIFGAPSEMLGVVTYGPVLAGDFNRDGIVNAADYIVWRKMNGQEVPRGTGADGNDDGAVNDEDFKVWKGHFGNTLASGAGAAADGNPGTVPEPSMGCLIVLALLSIAACRFRG